MYYGSLDFLETTVAELLPYTMEVNILSALQSAYSVSGSPAVVPHCDTFPQSRHQTRTTYGRLHIPNTQIYCNNKI